MKTELLKSQLLPILAGLILSSIGSLIGAAKTSGAISFVLGFFGFISSLGVLVLIAILVAAVILREELF